MSESKIAAMPHGRPTIGDVATLAGVSRPTVSAILNNRSYCYASKATRKRVRDAAEQLGYRPSPAAHGLLGKATATIGLVVTGFDVEPTTIKLCGFEAAARKAGKVTFIMCTDNQPEQEDTAIRQLVDRYVDGIAIYPCERGPHNELRKLIDKGFPVVTFDGHGRLDIDTDDISADLFAAGQLQARHLIEVGCRRICLVASEQRCYVNDQKIAGVQQAMQEAGLPLHIEWISMPTQTNQHWITDDLEQIRTFLSASGRAFDGVAALGDMISLGIMRIAVELGLRVPEDLAVIGCDGLSAAGQGAIPLSTITHDASREGREAYQLLHERLGQVRDPATPVTRIKMPVQLARRQSTARLPR